MVRVPSFDPVITELDGDERDYVRELRWWRVDELDRGEAEIGPSDLPQLLRKLLKDGPPSEPIEVSV
jgi:hypothetical protein